MKSAGSGFPYHPTYPQRIAATFHVGLSIRHQVDQVIFVRIAIESAELSFVVDNNKCQLCYRIITSRNGLWIWFGCMRITCDNSGIRILCCVRMRCGASFFFKILSPVWLRYDWLFKRMKKENQRIEDICPENQFNYI